MDDTANCPFCSIPSERIILGCEHSIAFLDGFPITEGHTLVTPLKHTASIYDLTTAEQTQLWAFVAQVKGLLAEKYQTDGFNIGVNDGVAAGQTIPHAHIHIIPRRKGDVADPRGGVRWIIPDKAPYWDKS